MAAWSFTPLSIAQGDRSERTMGMMVSASFFQTYGVDPVLGRAASVDPMQALKTD